MRKVVFQQSKALLTLILLVSCVNFIIVSEFSAMSSDDKTVVGTEGEWNDETEYRNITPYTIFITQKKHYLTIHDSNPINTITVKVTNHETSATVFENVYPQGQTSYIVIPISNWDAGSYTIELFGRENNGYLWGNFQVLP